MKMKLFHGSAEYNEAPILHEGLRKGLHHNLLCACCSSSFDEAQFFALRKTPASDMNRTGVIIEFDANLADNEYQSISSSGLLRNEKEIAVLNTKKLQPVAIWRFGIRGWQRHILEGITRR